MSDYAIEGLLGKGLIKEKYDKKSDDFIRNITKDGFVVLMDMMKDPMWRRVYLLMKRGATEEQINLFINTWKKSTL